MKNIQILVLYLIFTFTSCTPGQQESQVLTPGLYYPSRDLGELFEDVQTSGIFEDSKTFVDCRPKFSATTILAKYRKQKKDADFDMRAFVYENFNMPDIPKISAELDESPTLKAHIPAHWNFLTRPADDTAQFSSLIPLPNAYVVPGGRFREIYYWDSYFTMIGLGASGRTDLLKNMLDNFAYLVDRVGFIPNGNRTYFLGRSQPPFFSSMVMLYAQYEGKDAAIQYLPQLEKEYAFWMNGEATLQSAGDAKDRVVMLDSATVLNRYWDKFTTPRPEAHKEDVELAHRSGVDEGNIYRHIRAAAESGWDFSSRWFGGAMNMINIETTEIIPVDLNSLLFHLENTLAELNSLNGNANRAEVFLKKANDRKKAILKFCWSEEMGIFTDYNFVEQKITGIPTLAAMFPLYFKMASNDQASRQAQFVKNNMLFDGGLSATLNDSGQQWDKPNGWAPLQWISIKGLEHYDFKELALDVESRWLLVNRKVYQSTDKMMEKYNVLDTTLVAGGGEYPNQDGFGWTNGVAIALINDTEKY
jgi:alpha,alpha-trehalase